MKKMFTCILCLVLLGLMLTGCGSDADQTVPTLEIPQEYIPTASELSQSTRATTVYYRDADGYIVPVTRTIPWQDGIAAATLGLMVQNEQNIQDAAAMGLEPVLPPETQVSLDIGSDGLATVSLSSQVNACADALEESTMVSAVVCALTEFDSVDQVQLLVNGYAVPTLKYGTDISQPLSRCDLNVESIAQDVSLTGAQPVTLYFESAQSGAMVPVTRMVFSRDDVETAVLELLKGPRDGSGLVATMPGDAALLSVSQKDGVVTINFSEQFVNVANEYDGGKSAIKSLMLTCAQFEGVKQVKLQVNGKDWEPDAAAMAVPTFVNSEDDVYNYLTD